MKIQEQLEKLQDKLDLINSYRSVKFTLSSTKIKEHHKQQVLKDLEEFIQKRISEIDSHQTENKKDIMSNDFTPEEVKILKTLCKSLSEKKSLEDFNVVSLSSSVPNIDSSNDPMQGPVYRRKPKLATYAERPVRILAVSGGVASIQVLQTKEKLKVSVDELSDVKEVEDDIKQVVG